MNVLFLMADQINVRALSAYGGRHIQTPHLDRLAREGARFENAYCAWPVCSASRASILTGQYAHTHGITRNVDNPDLPSVTNDMPFTENLLHQRGWETHYVGRWHTGPRERLACFKGRTETRARGDYHQRELPAAIEQLRRIQPAIPLAGPHGSVDRPPRRQLCQDTVEMTPAVWEAHRRWQESRDAAFPIFSLIGRSIIPPEHQPETIYADQIIERLTNWARQRDETAPTGESPQPFMMTWSVNPPHDPVVIPEPYYSFVPRTDDLLPANHAVDPTSCDNPGPLGSASRAFVETVGREVVLEHIAVYLGMVKFVDDQVGRMLDALDALGLADDTLVIFTGDHGDMLGAHGMVYKSTLSFYEEIAKVPLLVRLPSHIPADRRIAAPVSLMDLAPTLLDYAGVSLPSSMQGISLRALIEGKTEQSPHAVVCERSGGRMVREGRWKYAWYETGQRWLFDLAVDPGETRNLAHDAAHAAARARLFGLLSEELRRTGDPLAAALQDG